MEREEQLQRLGELARTMTDAGLLFITTLPEADEHDLEKLRLLNVPYELFVVTIGEAPLARIPAQVHLPATASTEQAMECLTRALGAMGIVTDYQI